MDIQIRVNFKALQAKIHATPFSRDAYKKAMVVYDSPYLFDPVTKAWAFWVGTIQGFSNKIGSWRSSQPRAKESLLNYNKKQLITPALKDRLELVQIENMDAVKLILSKDTPTTFFYIDPPYVGANQGHYGGYTQEHFENLLNILPTLKGKFLLSSYPNELLTKYRKQYGWYNADKDMCLSVSRSSNKRKVECLTSNYSIK